MSKQPTVKIQTPAGWDAYKGKAAIDVVLARQAYKDVGDISSEELENMAKKMPEGYQFLWCTDYMDDTKAHKYRAGVFINNQTKEIVVASAGTRFGATIEGAHDLYNDAVLAMEKMPPKVESAGVLNQILLDSLGEKASEYKFHYTGHSLGAALSDMAAADMAIRCRKAGIDLGVGATKKISTMTFDNPGAKKVIRKMYKNAGLDPSNYSEDVDYKGVNNKKNLVNQATAHAGKMWEIVPDGQNNTPTAAQTWGQYIAHKLQKITPIISRVIETLSFGGLKEQLDSHSLTHFENVLLKEAGHVRESNSSERKKPYLIEFLTGCKRILFDKKVFSKVTTMKEEHGDVGRQEFVMQNPMGRFTTASKAEVAKAKGVAAGKGGVDEQTDRQSTRFRDMVSTEKKTAHIRER